MATFNEMRLATLAARARTGDNAISSCVKSGLIQINRVVYVRQKKTADVIPLSGFVSSDEALQILNALE